MTFRWFMNKIFNMFQKNKHESYDKFLKNLMDNAEDIKITRHTIMFKYDNKTYEVWIANKFYSYGHLHTVDNKFVEIQFRFRPSYKIAKEFYSLEKKLNYKDTRVEDFYKGEK